MKHFLPLLLVLVTGPLLASEWQFGARDKGLLARQHQQAATICTVIKSTSSPVTFMNTQGKDPGIKGPNSMRQQILNVLNHTLGEDREAHDIQQMWWKQIAGPADCDRFLFWDKPVAAACQSRSDMAGPVCDAVRAFQSNQDSDLRFIREDELSELLTRQETAPWTMEGAMEAPYETSPVMSTTTRVGNGTVKLSITAPLQPMPWWEGLESGIARPPDTNGLVRWEEGTPGWVEPVIMLEANAQALWLNRGRRIEGFTLYSDRKDGRVILATEKSDGYLPPPWGTSQVRSRLGQKIIVPMKMKEFERFHAGSLHLDVTFYDGSTTKVTFGARSSAYYAIELKKFWRARDGLHRAFVAREEQREKERKQQQLAQSRRERQTRARAAFQARIRPLQDEAIALINQFMDSVPAQSSCGRAPREPESMNVSDSYIDRWNREIGHWFDCEVAYQKQLSRRWESEVNRKLANLSYDGVKGGLRGDRVMGVYNSSVGRINSYVRRSGDRMDDFERRIRRWNSRVEKNNASVRRRETTRNILSGMREALEQNQRWYDTMPIYDNSYYVTPGYN